MKTRKQLVDEIRRKPGETLDDITMLRQELLTEKLVNSQLEKRLKIAEFVSSRAVAKVAELRNQLRLADAIHLNRRV